ncbi:PIN domain-containing protein [Fictibacillus fluitans]|uniref:PIN domain-containing protein n=1 Tax=Fictibacillus fluitans TaxID=3058422 RepID=A0ABT8I035_9BACL|nr:PIN-like domain-containing protein [Fictibacillus sp. NE201]MDN4526402.1 PIN domain-containing protein [Fictibacillus sp. NE201]
MIQSFRGYYRPTEAEFDELWSDCLFVFDTNVLLNFFRTEDEIRSKLLNILELLKDRVFVPYQVAMEYHHRLQEEIHNQNKTYNNMNAMLTKKFGDIKNDINNKYNRHVNLNLEKIFEVLEQSLSTVKKEIESQKQSHPLLDETARKIAHLLESCVGSSYETQEELDDLYKEGELRFQNKIPPGFGDLKEKKDRNRNHLGLIYQDVYGDFLVWKQILMEASEKRKNVIIVTGDSEKGDWWLLDKNKNKIAPHPQLLQEFHKETEGELCYIYDPDEFIRRAYEFFKLGSEEESVKVAKGMTDVSDTYNEELLMDTGLDLFHLGSYEKDSLYFELKEAKALDNSSMYFKAIRDAKKIIDKRKQEVVDLHNTVNIKIFELASFNPGLANSYKSTLNSIDPNTVKLKDLRSLLSKLDWELDFYLSQDY